MDSTLFNGLRQGRVAASDWPSLARVQHAPTARVRCRRGGERRFFGDNG